MIRRASLGTLSARANVATGDSNKKIVAAATAVTAVSSGVKDATISVATSGDSIAVAYGDSNTKIVAATAVTAVSTYTIVGTPASTTIKFTSTSGIAAGGTITIVGTARTSFAGSDASTCTATKKTGSTIVTLGALTSAILTRQSLVYNLGSVAIAAEDTSSK